MNFLTRISIVAVVCLTATATSFCQVTAPQSKLPVVTPDASDRADQVYFDAVKALMLGDDKQEEDLMMQFSKLKPEEPAAYYNLSRIYIRQNRADKALEYIKKAIALDDGNKWYKEQYGNILAFKNQFLEAADVFAGLAKTEKQNTEYLLKAALLYQRGGNNKEALVLLDKLIARTGESEDYLLQKQQIYLKMNDVDGAARTIQQLIDQNPKEAKYYTLLAEVYDNNKQSEKAVVIYEKAEKMFPDDPAVQLSLASHYHKQKNMVKYDAYVKKVITNKTLDAETQLGLLLPYLHELNDDTARRAEGIELARQLTLQHPDNVQVISFYGDVLSLNGQRDKATEQYKKAIDIDPSRYTTWQQLLYSYTDRSGADSLIAYSEKAARLFPNQAIIYYLNGIGYFNKREYKTAIKSINRAVDMQPDDNGELLAEMYSTLGDIYFLIKENTLCDSSYEKAMRADPKNASVLNNYAYYLSVRGARLEDAERMSKQSLELRPDEATFLDTYGWILYKEGKYEKAKEYIQQAVDKSGPNADGTLLDHLGDVYYKLKNTEKAVEYWRKAKEKGADNNLIDKKIQDQKLYE